jgi:hypothetical protein
LEEQGKWELIVWNWHIPGVMNGFVGVRTPRELGGTIKEGKGGNKTQAGVLHLLKRLPKPLEGSDITSFLIISLFLLDLLNTLVPRALQSQARAGTEGE